MQGPQGCRRRGALEGKRQRAIFKRKRWILWHGRIAGRFPAADTAHRGEISIWTSNDYLGISGIQTLRRR